MVRNLKRRNLRLPSPMRSWTKKTGPFELSLIDTATTSNSGRRAIRRAREPQKSTARFAATRQPSIAPT